MSGDGDGTSTEDGVPAADARPASLVAGARAVVCASEPMEKVRIAHATARAWRERSLSLGSLSADAPMPDRPGRPVRPELRPPRDMPRRSVHGERGRIALLHSLAHIELNAVDMTWDLVGRFAHENVPRSFFDDWVEVGDEEAGHFALVSRRLDELGAAYGAVLPRGTSVAVNRDQGKVLFEVKDNGVGFDSSRAPSTLGLTGVRERARLIGALVDIRSGFGEGTQVRLEVPVPSGVAAK